MIDDFCRIISVVVIDVVLSSSWSSFSSPPEFSSSSSSSSSSCYSNTMMMMNNNNDQRTLGRIIIVVVVVVCDFVVMRWLFVDRWPIQNRRRRRRCCCCCYDCGNDDVDDDDNIIVMIMMMMIIIMIWNDDTTFVQNDVIIIIIVVVIVCCWVMIECFACLSDNRKRPLSQDVRPRIVSSSMRQPQANQSRQVQTTTETSETAIHPLGGRATLLSTPTIEKERVVVESRERGSSSRESSLSERALYRLERESFSLQEGRGPSSPRSQ